MGIGRILQVIHIKEADGKLMGMRYQGIRPNVDLWKFQANSSANLSFLGFTVLSGGGLLKFDTYFFII